MVKALYGMVVILVAGCGGLADSNGGDAGADRGHTSHVDSGPVDGAARDGGEPDVTLDSARDVVAADVSEDFSSGAEAGDSGSPTPNCAPGGPGLTDCGASKESCCTSLDVPGGTFYRTYTNSGDGGFGEADPATVSGLRLDKYLVTVGRFRQFVAAWKAGTGYVPPAGSGKHTHLNGGNGLANGGSPVTYEPGWVISDDSHLAPTDKNLVCDSSGATWTASAGSHENLPMSCVNWAEAYAFCIWDGGFLPSEAESEYAAAGGSQQREYPWGSMAPGTANQYAIYGCYYPSSSGTCVDVSNFAPVGTATLGVGLWGQLDMSGDVSEWNLDLWPLSGGYVDPCTDCVDTTTGNGRVLRGGNANDEASSLLTTYTGQHPEYGRSFVVGFRCARTP